MLMILYTTTSTHNYSLFAREANRPVTIPTTSELTWQDRASCSGLTQLVRSWELLACRQLRSGSPLRRL